tara:strand:+ start:461 stop:604 length:144 start_codon:yes stop_codon:yes gene_type:complete
MGVVFRTLKFPGKFMENITPPYFVKTPPEGRGVTEGDPMGGIPIGVK